MLGKASELKISDVLSGSERVRTWFKDHPSALVLDIKATGTEDGDYFFIIYKEAPHE